MFYNYEIHNNGKEDILYLFLTMKYEFSSEFNLQDENDLKRRTKNFIQSNHIPFHGNHIYLIVDGIVAWMAAQVMTNVASMIGLIPLTGVTLPLISYGGSSMMIVSVALGIVMAISEYTGRRNISETERDGNIKNPVFGTVRRRRV